MSWLLLCSHRYEPEGQFSKKFTKDLATSVSNHYHKVHIMFVWMLLMMCYGTCILCHVTKGRSNVLLASYVWSIQIKVEWAWLTLYIMGIIMYLLKSLILFERKMVCQVDRLLDDLLTWTELGKTPFLSMCV